MSIAAIIAEYHPFHTGHAWQIKRTKEITGCDHVIAIMSGDYVQRGTPAMMDKYLRTRLALMGGADAILEMPVWISTASAQDFALGCVRLLDRLGCVDYLSFGSEEGKLSRLEGACRLFLEEPEAYKLMLKEGLARGMSFPRARKAAYEQFTGENGDFLDSPNNILGISYLMALKLTGSPIKPITVFRDNDYHEETLGGNPAHYASAGAIRNALTPDNQEKAKREIRKESGVFSDIAPYLTDQASVELLYEAYQKEYPVSMDDYWLLLKNRLLTLPSCLEYEDMSEALNNRLMKSFFTCNNVSELCDALKTEGFTAARIRRALLHILLGIRKEDCQFFKDHGAAGYLRVLGIRKTSLSLLSDFSKKSDIPVVSGANIEKSLADAVKNDTICSEAILLQNRLETYCDNLYESVKCSKFQKCPPIHEKSRRFLIL